MMYMKRKKQLPSSTIIVLLVTLTLFLMGIFLAWGLNAKNIDYFLPKRFIKIATIILVSYSIGYSSVVFQTITNNRILTPSIMGLDSLYLFVQTFVVFFFGSGQLSMMTGYKEFFISLGFMLGASWLLFLLLFKGDGRNIYFLVLSGMILGNLFGGMSTFMQVLLDPNEFFVLQGKMFASLNNVNTDLFEICALIVLIIIFITWKDYRKLDVVSLGQDHAINLGVAYKKIIMKSLMIISLLISISTILIGPITFLGILVVSLSREIMKSYRHTYLVSGAVLLSCLSLTFGLIIVEKVFKFDTTIGVIINFVGGIYFIYIMLKESKR